MAVGLSIFVATFDSIELMTAGASNRPSKASFKIFLTGIASAIIGVTTTKRIQVRATGMDKSKMDKCLTLPLCSFNPEMY